MCCMEINRYHIPGHLIIEIKRFAETICLGNKKYVDFRNSRVYV